MNWLAMALIIVIVPLALNKLKQSGHEAAAHRDGKLWLEYGKSVKLFSFIAVMVPVGISITLFYVDADDIFSITMLVALFSVLTIPLFLESFFVKICFDDTTLYCYSPWRPSRTVPLNELKPAYYSDLMKWWVIPTQQHGFIRLPDFISGKDDLLNKLNEINQQDIV
ncbi:MAG: hypothetical protein OEY36_06280 [Gammaproteobacteria bacterium]|nr:hypothetical protein [Gammaproteobacteria bacterium]